MGLLKRKEEKTEVISVRVPGSAKAELDELRQRAEAGGFDLAGSMRRWCGSSGRSVRSSASPPAPPRTHHARCDRSGGPMCPGRSMVRRRSHNCGVERAAADAACSPVALRGGPDTWHRSRQHQCGAYGVLKNQRQWECGGGLTCCARFFR